MRNLLEKISFTTLILLLFAVVTGHAATKGRVMANGKVTLFKNGKPLTTYTEQGPVDENALIACDGSCMVKMQGITLSAVDKTRFAVKESGGALNLFVETGKLNFIVTDMSQQFAFYSPNSYYVKTEGFVAPAATNSAAKGFIQVNDKTTEIGMDTGSMMVQTADGAKTVKPGQSIVLAMAEVPDNAGNSDGGKNSNDDSDKGGGFAWSNLSDNPQITTLIVGAGIVGGIALGSALLWDHDDDNVGGPPPPPQPQPQPQPPPQPPSRPRPRPPASPNR